MQFSDSKISKDVIDIAARIMRGEKIEEKKKLDPVDKDELKGKHAARDDKDIDNDGDSDESDEYLHKKRKAISKSMKEEEGEIEEGFSSADRPQQTRKIKRPKQGDYKNYIDLRPSKLNAPGGRDKVKYTNEAAECDCDCGKSPCEECGKDHHNMKEGQKPIKLKGFGKDKAGMASIKSPIARAALMRGADTGKPKTVAKEEAILESDSYYAHHDAVKKAGGKTSGSDYDHHLGNEMKKRGYSKGSYRGHGQYNWDKTHKPTNESDDMDTDNAQKAVKHDCATHVVHKEHGEGRCVPGMHTLEENEDGTGYVTHYDVMFSGEEGPYIVEDCPVEVLEIVKEMHHGHKKKK
jgi:hypothetical protein